MQKVLQREYVISCGNGTPILVQDRENRWEVFGEDNLSDYLKAGYEIFLERINVLKTLNESVSQYEEKELIFMLEALIAAKNILYKIKPGTTFVQKE